MESDTVAVMDLRRSFAKNAISRSWIKYQFGSKSTPQALSSASNTAVGLKVLVVDAEKKSAEGLCCVLERWGHDCAIALSGLDALRTGAWYQPQVAIITLEMPWMLGTEVAKHLRADFRKADCLIIGLTSDAEYQQRQETGANCIDLLLARPLNLGVLKTLLILETAYQLRLLKAADVGAKSSCYAGRNRPCRT